MSQFPTIASANSPAIEPILVRLDDAVRISGLSRTVIYMKLASGDLIARKAGKRTLVEMASLRALVDRLPVATIRAPRRAAGETP